VLLTDDEAVQTCKMDMNDVLPDAVEYPAPANPNAMYEYAEFEADRNARTLKKVVSKITEKGLLSPDQCKLLVLDEMGYDCIGYSPWGSGLVDYATRTSRILKNVLNLRRIDPDYPGGKPRIIT
jgi:hypothetical protein